MQGTSALAMKLDQKTHTTRLSLGEYFNGVDVFVYLKDCICILVYLRDYILFFYFKSNLFLLFMV
jgi:hypothetical protein